MVHAITVFCAYILFACAAAAEVNLTPRVEEYEGDGMKFKQLVFADGDSRVIYGPPANWDYAGSPKLFKLHPRGKGQAEALVYSIPVQKPRAFDEESAKHLVAEVISQSPAGSSGIAVVASARYPLMIERKETYQVTVRYSNAGSNFVRSTIFLNREREQFRFELVCREEDFKELGKQFQGSLYSLQNL